MEETGIARIIDRGGSRCPGVLVCSQTLTPLIVYHVMLYTKYFQYKNLVFYWTCVSPFSPSYHPPPGSPWRFEPPAWFRHMGQPGDVASPILIGEDVERAAVDHSVEPAIEVRQGQCVLRGDEPGVEGALRIGERTDLRFVTS